MGLWKFCWYKRGLDTVVCVSHMDLAESFKLQVLEVEVEGKTPIEN